MTTFTDTTTYWETSTSTTVTQTQTTTTTMPAQTTTSDAISSGDDVIPLTTLEGFSIGDMIGIGGVENVEIIAYATHTGSGGRRLADNAVQVQPAVSQSFPSGTSIQNLGPAILFSGSDPITFYRGQKFKFWLPLHQELLLLESPDVKVFGTAFPGPEAGQQWFDSLRVALPDDSPVALVRTKRDASNRTSRRCTSRKFESLDVLVGRSSRPLPAMESPEFTAGPSVRFQVGCRIQDRPLLNSPRTEYIHFETPSLVFIIVAAHAGNEFPDDPQLALQYRHVDFIVMEMTGERSFTGVLPEIWDISPRSEAVKSMLQPPDEELPPRVCKEQSNSSVC